jgi:hypothetical protein
MKVLFSCGAILFRKEAGKILYLLLDTGNRWDLPKGLREENENEEEVIRIGTYGKSKHSSEHFHIKLFPWAGKIGQPYTVDTTFEKSKIYLDEFGKEFVKLEPIKKVKIDEIRLNDLSNKFISLLKWEK